MRRDRFEARQCETGCCWQQHEVAGFESESILPVNGKAAGSLPLPGDGVMTRHQMSARWYEFEVPFDASLLQAGENMLTITVPEGSLNSGVIYDYLRLELDETTTA